MFIKYATQAEHEGALIAVNQKYDNNIEFNTFLEHPNGFYRVTLRCPDLRKKGCSLSPKRFGPPKPIATACYHVYKLYFSSLPFTAELWVQGDAGEWMKIPTDGGHFPDRFMERDGYWLSQMCPCDRDWSILRTSMPKPEGGK